MATFSVNETARRVQYVSTGQTTYNFNFQVNAASELQVYVNDTLQVDSVSYSATIGSSGSGSIAFINNSGSGGTNYTPSNGDYITIIGDLPLSRTTSLNNAADITTTNLDTEFDNTLFRQQQLKEMMDRSIQLKVTTPRTVTSTGTNGPLQFPYDATVSNNADKLIAYDSNGTSLILGPTSAGLTTLTSIASEVQTLAGISSDITTVAGMQSNISTVISNSTNINSVATNITNINTNATNISSITTVATDITNVNQLANALNLETTFVVTVANPGSGNVFVIDGSNNPTLSLDRGATYIFDLSNSSNAGHPLAFKDGSGNAYTTGVTTTGTAGSSGAKVTIEVASNAPSSLRYYCTVHGNGMGNTISVVNNNLATVAGNITNINNVASDIANVNTAATNIANINSVAGNATNINAVNSNATNINAVAGDISNINSVAGNSTNINAVAGNSTNINAVNTNSSNINAVAGNATNINTVAGDTTEINAVAGNATNINTVAGNNTNINTVAGANSNITSVAGSISNVNTVATNIADVNNFSDTYRISANAPTTSLDVGDLWFDTTNNVMKVYSSSGWITAASAVNGTANRFTYTATAGQTTFTGADDSSNTLAYDAGFVDIYLNGIKLVSGGSADYVATNGTSVVLNTAAAVNDILQIVAYGTFELANFSINAASDVNTTGLATNDLLRYDGTNFVPKSFDEITPSQSSNANKFLTTDGTNSSWSFVNAANLTGSLPAIDGSALTGIETGTDWQSSIKTSNFTAAADKGYWIDTSSNTVTVTFPSSASVGNTIELVDYARNWGTNKIIINQNGLNFQGFSSPNPEYNTDGQSVRFVYSGSTKGWIPNSDDDVTDEVPQGYSIDFLVIAGGGAGGSHHGGGGGAGGYRTSTQTINAGTAITVTVGDGGTATSSNSENGGTGSNSSISGTGVTTITSAGGAGGAKGAASVTNGLDGGSGSGGGGHPSSGTTGGSGNTPSTSPSQGNNGGNGNGSQPELGGGGGGAGGTGFAGGSGGAGGNGAASSITGSSVTRAGGGGGGARSDGTAGSGGSGGGGAGSNFGSGAATAGTANTGSGGGAGGRQYGTGANFSNSGAGGKGVVILSVPTARYTSTTTGSPTVTTSGSNTIIQFNGTGSYTT